MLHATQSRDGQNTKNAIRIPAESDLAAVGRPGRAAVADVARKLNGLFSPHCRCIDSGLAGAITLTECDQRTVRRKSRRCLESMHPGQRYDFDLVLRGRGSLRINEGNDRHTDSSQAKTREQPESC